jgi:ribosomal protein L29
MVERNTEKNKSSISGCRRRHLLYALCQFEVNNLFLNAPYEFTLSFLPLEQIKLPVFAAVVEKTHGQIAYYMPTKELREWCIRYVIECVKINRLSGKALNTHIKWMLEEEDLDLFQRDTKELAWLDSFQRKKNFFLQRLENLYGSGINDERIKKVRRPLAQTEIVLSQKEKTEKFLFDFIEAMKDTSIDHHMQTWCSAMKDEEKKFRSFIDMQYHSFENFGNVLYLYYNMAKSHPTLHIMYMFGYPPDPIRASCGDVSLFWKCEGGRVKTT